MIYIISIVFVLSVLVFFHELGHFIFAKLFGVRVERFSIGFPPRLFGVKWGETDYCISAIPFGGYVKMTGVVDESMDVSSLTGAPHEFASKKWWQKTLILVGGVVMNMVLAWLILSALLNLEGEMIIPGTTVGTVVEGGIMEQAGVRQYDKILRINGQEVNTWNDVRDVFLDAMGQDLKMVLQRGGETVEISLPAERLGEKNGEILDISPLLSSRVGEVVPGTPASKSGLQRGDLILAISGQPVQSWNEMTEIIKRNPEKPLELLVQRSGAELTMPITPEPMDEIDEEGVSHIVGKIGIGIYFDHNQLPLLPALREGMKKTFLFTTINVKALGWMITGKKSAKEMIGGPIMITKMAGDFAKSGFLSLLELIAHLSIMLAIVNVLPIPALDGGHITIVLIEQIRRKPLTTKTKLKIQQVGMAILFVLMFFVIYNDIVRLF